ncbi:hypothetical protein SAMN05421831_1015 [Allopseudospirillum japonicum]|uniref:Uncharacterized protein n=1 Tax=Allopseudospirillum japonicum TaxID=64971 RepID=A0A1H6Q5P3_9GAMM|nr:hypothetical protein SAMN05421831_1015 [Allopseudospirillum japonicum]
MSILHLTTEGRPEYSRKGLTCIPDQTKDKTLYEPTR